MGIGRRRYSSSSSYSVPIERNITSSNYGKPVKNTEYVYVPTPDPGNPDPRKYVLEEEYQGQYGVAVKIRYPNCTNYEGNKILVYLGLDSFSQVLIKNKMEVDPHFFDGDSHYSPTARFEPTVMGWRLAKSLTNTNEPAD